MTTEKSQGGKKDRAKAKSLTAMPSADIQSFFQPRKRKASENAEASGVERAPTLQESIPDTEPSRTEKGMKALRTALGLKLKKSGAEGRERLDAGELAEDRSLVREGDSELGVGNKGDGQESSHEGGAIEGSNEDPTGLEKSLPADREETQNAKVVAAGADADHEVELLSSEEMSDADDDEVGTEKGDDEAAGKRKTMTQKTLKGAKVAVKKRKGKGAKKGPGIGEGLITLALKHGSYDPRGAATWKEGEPVPFLYLALALQEIGKESGRLSMTEMLCNVFRTVMAVTPADLLSVVYLSANRVAPSHEGVELGIGDATIIKVLAEATGRKESQIKSEYKETGDLGLVAQASRSNQRTMFAPQPLTCQKVLEAFRFIAKESGAQSQDKKRARMKQLLVAARDCEPQFLVRLLQGKMRIGLAEQTVLASLAQAAVLQEEPPVPSSALAERLEEAGRLMKAAYSVLPVYEKIVAALVKGGVRQLPLDCRFTLGIPVGPMLAKPTHGISEVLNKFQDLQFTCEYKYDGERAQLHYLPDGSVHIYSRNAENTTQKFPDVVASVPRFIKDHVKSFVLDAEVVAFDREKGRILPFQVLATRARKGVIVGDIKVQVCLFAFDLLYLNGRELLQEQLKTRRELLHDSFIEVDSEFHFATSIIQRDVEELQSFLDEAVNHGCEGCMVKTLEEDSTYEPSKRSNNWLKLKKDYMDNLGDSLDLVPVGAFHGRGKRAGVFGAFLLACYDEDREEYQSICKIGTGFSEAVLEECSTSLRSHSLDKPPAYYRWAETLGVDVWFSPAEVWEVRAADLSISPVHKAGIGMVDPGKGIALRFPRFLRKRQDKSPEQATTADQVVDMYRAQKIHHRADGDNDL